MKFSKVEAAEYLDLRIHLHKNLRLAIFMTFFMKIISSGIYWGIVTAAFQESNKHNSSFLKIGNPGFGPAIGMIYQLIILLINRIYIADVNNQFNKFQKDNNACFSNRTNKPFHYI